jgi:6-pyruvoyltetrahydropterin/6-carboxytetrahydropterin synthase
MIATLSKRFTFDAAHCLPKLDPGHKCARLHGHTYQVEIVCRGPVDENGFVIDYDAIAHAWEPIHRALDHRYLNDIPGLEQPSTENLLAWIFKSFHDEPRPGDYAQVWALLDTIRIYESSTTWCEMTKEQWLAFCGPNS